MPKWKAENSLQFINTLNKTKINDLHKYLQHMEMNMSSFTKVCYRHVQQNIWYFFWGTRTYTTINIIHLLNTETALHKSPGLVYSVVEYELNTILLRKSIAEIIPSY